MILNALKYSEMNLTAIVISVSVSIFLILVTAFINRYFKYMDKKEENAEKRNCEVTTRLDSLRETMLAMSFDFKHYSEKVDETAKELQDVVKKVDKIEWHLWPEIKTKK